MNGNRIILEACLARKASHTYLDFERVDYPEVDLPEWNQWVTVKQDQGIIKANKLPLDYHGDLKKNYDDHCGL